MKSGSTCGRAGRFFLMIFLIFLGAGAGAATSPDCAGTSAVSSSDIWQISVDARYLEGRVSGKGQNSKRRQMRDLFSVDLVGKIVGGSCSSMEYNKSIKLKVEAVAILDVHTDVICSMI